MTIRQRLYRLQDRHGDWRRIICCIRGHEYPAMLVPACCLYFCRRCGRELLSRTIDQIDELESMTDDVREALDQLDQMDEFEGDGT